MILAQKVLAPGAWHPTEVDIEVEPLSIRFERFTVSQASSYAGSFFP